MSGALLLNVQHVPGTRMMQQGTDGLSRGDLNEGVMSGTPMLSFIPLHLSALARRPEILSWIRDWTGVSTLTPLSPEEWFDRGHGYVTGELDRNGIWILTETGDTWVLWSPPPAIANIAVDELLLSRHKHTNINHLFIVPRLSTHTWRKKLHKVCDLVFEVPAGCRAFWPSLEHEPLIIGLTLRFVHCSPWQLKQAQQLLDLGGQLRPLWQAQEGAEGTVLHKLSALPGTLEAMSLRVVR